jgi:type II secretory pathway pseudopilin PulG
MTLGERQGGPASALPLASTRLPASRWRQARRSKSVRRIRDNRAAGFSLVEWLIILAILGLFASFTLPDLFRWTRSLRVDLATRELQGVLRLARSRAIREGTKVGVKFRTDGKGRYSFTLYRDGDGDGVLTRDIDAGVDPPLSPPRELVHLGQQIGLGFPAGPAPRDPGDPRRRLTRLDDPIRFNRSDIASFNHLGASTPGSLYVTDGLHFLSVVRVFGRTGKVKIMRYDVLSETWR